MPKAFARFNIAISGDFGKERTLEDLKRWISKNGGNYSKNVDQNVTHLVCSKEHYKKESQAVKKAKPIKTCSIVTYDWLEDCCQNKRRRPCGKYLCKTVFKETIKEKAERRNREKTALKKDGPPPESATGVVFSFLDNHIDDLNNKRTSGKPDIEAYTLYDDMYKKQKKQETGGDDSDGEDDEADTSTNSKDEIEDMQAEERGNGPSDMKSSAVMGTVPASLSSFAKRPSSTPSSYPRSSADSTSPSLPSQPSDFAEAIRRTEVGAPSAVTTQSLEGKPQSHSFDTQSSHTTTLSQLAAVIARKPKSGVASPTALGKRRATSPSLASPPARRAFLHHYTDPPLDIEFHHLYRDITGFTYNITLVRLILTQNTNERYAMRLYESHTTPHTYAVHLRFYASRKNTATTQAMGEMALAGVVIAPAGSTWAHAFGVFKSVFEEQTGLAWENRLEKMPATRVMADGARFFNYAKPREGDPRGLMAPPSRRKILSPTFANVGSSAVSASS